MNGLIEYLSARPLPTTSRPNVSPEQPVQSMTLGMVNVRQSYGCQISEATTHDRFHLLRRLLALLQDPDLTGQRPTNFTSICCNVDYACALHTDKYNSGCSHIVAGGDYRGGGASKTCFLRKAQEMISSERKSPWLFCQPATASHLTQA